MTSDKTLIDNVKENIYKGFNKEINKYKAFIGGKYRNGKWQELKNDSSDQPFLKKLPYPKLKYSEKKISEVITKFKKKSKSWKNVVYIMFVNKLPDDCKKYSSAKLLKRNMNEKCEKKSGKKQNCMPQINKKSWNKDDGLPTNKTEYGYCIYVGKCQKDTNRMEHHFNKITGKGTYGLHLGEWFDKPVTIYFFVFGNSVSEEYLKIIEEILWESYKPLFGQIGSR